MSLLRPLDPSFPLERQMAIEAGPVMLVNVGGDQLLVDANGESRISVQDYAVAMIDELERPAHIRQRFTVGY